MRGIPSALPLGIPPLVLVKSRANSPNVDLHLPRLILDSRGRLLARFRDERNLRGHCDVSQFDIGTQGQIDFPMRLCKFETTAVDPKENEVATSAVENANDFHTNELR